MIKLNKTSKHSKLLPWSIASIISILIFIALLLVSRNGHIYSIADVIVHSDFINLSATLPVFLTVANLITYCIYCDFILEGELLIVKSTIRKRQFTIAKIDIMNIKVFPMPCFVVTIVADRFYEFSWVCYTKENFKVLKELLQTCENAHVTIAELDEMIKHAWVPLD